MRLILFFTGVFLFLVVPLSPQAQEANCVTCHRKLVQGKHLHSAMDSRIGCTVCHSGIIAKYSPHKKSNMNAMGLTAMQPDLCYTCHEKGLFTGKVIHTALDTGCTVCHNPHSTDTAKLLVAAEPDLCYTCHDKGMLTKKTVHSPVSAGMCLACHSPHSSDEMALLLNKPVDVCLACHADVPAKAHGAALSSAGRHPLGGPTTTAQGKSRLLNPAQPGKPYYCGSCHSPHSTDTPHLFLFEAKSPEDLCAHCHKNR